LPEGAQALIAFANVSISRFLVRRGLLALLGVGAAGLLLVQGSAPSFADRRDGPVEVSVEELMKPSDLPDIAIGPADAKVTVVEYGSMTCGHCAHFANDVFDEFKKKFVDTGKIRYIFRDFPLDNLAAAVSMLVRCAGGDKALPLIETFYAKQADWAFAEGNPVPKLFDIAKQAGFTQESFDKCLTDQKLLDQITAERKRASETFGVNATPTFFINGKRLQEAPTVEALAKVIEPLLAAK
jgi:protein-disulfide isomerase